MTKAEYIDGVMRRLNESGWDDSTAGMFLGGDTSRVEKHVEGSFADAWRRAVALFPLHYFNHAPFALADHHCDVSLGTGFVVLPADFYVLASFRMRGWRMSCLVAPEETQGIASVQSNEFVRGNFCRPVCTLSVHPKYGRILKYYSLPKGDDHVIEEALYVGLATSLDDAVSSLDARLAEPLQWLNASAVFTVFEKVELAKVAEERAILTGGISNAAQHNYQL